MTCDDPAGRELLALLGVALGPKSGSQEPIHVVRRGRSGDGAGGGPGVRVELSAANVDGVLDDLLVLGRALGREAQSTRAVVALRARLHEAAERVDPYADPPRGVLLESLDPLIVGGLWRAELFERAGARHVLNEPRASARDGSAAGPQAGARRGPPPREVTRAELIGAQPEVIVVCLAGRRAASGAEAVEALANEPWWRALPAVGGGRVEILDGDLLHVPGVNLVDAFERLVDIVRGA